MASFLQGVLGSFGAAPPPSSASAALAQGTSVGAPGRTFIELEQQGGAAGAPRGFAGLFGGLLEDARSKDVEAQQAVEAFARSDDPGRIHETMVAVSKAEIALRTVAAVRNKLLEAYRDLQHVTS